MNCIAIIALGCIHNRYYARAENFNHDRALTEVIKIIFSEEGLSL